MGQLAQQRGSHAQVKEFGLRMVTDHTKANDELKRVADAKACSCLPRSPQATSTMQTS
jgi:predicted outer membrane protein